MSDQLTWHEAKILRAARDLMAEKPEETLAYLSGASDTTDKHLITLALRAQLEQMQRAQNSMRVTTALVKHLEDSTQLRTMLDKAAGIIENEYPECDERFDIVRVYRKWKGEQT